MEATVPTSTISIPDATHDEDREDYWQTRIEDWRQSGLSQAEYTRQQGLTISQFGYWKRKLDPAPSGPPQKTFVAVATTPNLTMVRFHHPNGLTIECAPRTDVPWLQQLMGMFGAS